MDRDSPIEIEPALRDAVAKVAEAEGSTITQFVNGAIAARLASTDPHAYWAARAARAKPGALLRFLKNAGDEPPREGDRIEDEPSPQA